VKARPLFWLVLMALVATGVAVSAVRHQTRMEFSRIQQLQKRQDELVVEWGRLQLERATWSDAGKIRALAERQLGMYAPEDEIVVVVE